MNRTNKDIKNYFEVFKELLQERKVISEAVIKLNPKRHNAYWLIGSSSVKHDTIQEEIILIVEKSKRDAKYGIKLRCSTITEEPFFRFDSDGPAHRNDDPEIPLEEQLVTTPHFNSFNEEGKPIAYENDALKDNASAKVIVNDIDSGLANFCKETNSELSNGGYPTVLLKEPEFDFGEVQNVNFDNVNFE